MSRFPSLRIWFLYLILSVAAAARILPKRESGPPARKKDKFYESNTTGCASGLLARLFPGKRPNIDHDKARAYCTELGISCCAAEEIKVMAEAIKGPKQALKKQLDYITDFLNFAEALNAEKFTAAALTLKEKEPKEKDPKEKEKDNESETRSYSDILTNDMKITRGNMNGYFNNLVMNQSGMICQVCDYRFGTLFFEDGGKLVVSEDQCNKMLENENRLLGFASQLTVMLRVAEVLNKDKQGKPEFDSVTFAKRVEEVKKDIDACSQLDLDEDLSDEEIEKAAKNTNSLSDPLLVSADTGVDSEQAEALKTAKCQNLCRNFLPFKPVKLLIDIFPAIEHLRKALAELSVVPPKSSPLPGSEGVLFFPVVANIDEGKPIAFKSTALNFFSFPLQPEHYEIGEVADLEETDMKEEEIVPPRTLAWWQKLYNALFGWLFTPYEL